MGTNLRKLNYRLLIDSIMITALCCLFIFFVYTFFDEKNSMTTALKKITQSRRYHTSKPEIFFTCRLYCP